MTSPRAASGQPWAVCSVPGLEVVRLGSGIHQPEPTRELRHREGDCPKCESTCEPAEHDFDAQEHRAAALPCTMFSARLPRNRSEITFPCCDCPRVLVHPARAAEAPHLKPHLLFICDEEHGLRLPQPARPAPRSRLPASLRAAGRPIAWFRGFGKGGHAPCYCSGSNPASSTSWLCGFWLLFLSEPHFPRCRIRSLPTSGSRTPFPRQGPVGVLGLPPP